MEGLEQLNIERYEALLSELEWPDLVKFHYFGKMSKHFGHFESDHLVFGNISSLILSKFDMLYYEFSLL